MDFYQFFKDKNILITGGTGSIGSEIVRSLLKYEPKSIRVFSNSENEIWETKQRFKKDEKKIRLLLGDVRNFERVKKAMDGVDLVFHAAAIKHVPISEYNPIEAVEVNVLGLQNVIEAAIQHGVKRLINISTDKAVNPSTVMGATKMIGERLCTSRQLSLGTHPIIISSVRFGNVLGSRGSIIPLIKDMILKDETIQLTDKNMRRFFMSVQQATELVLKSMLIAQGAEIFVLKMPTMCIKDLFEVIVENYASKVGKNPSSIKIEEVGIRPGEKIDEELISINEYPSCYDKGDMFVIYPPDGADFIKEMPPRALNKHPDAKNARFYNTKDAIPLNKDEIKQLLITEGFL
jgi:UDP-N-acetylglucosamine 4,6-dehydratase